MNDIVRVIWLYIQDDLIDKIEAAGVSRGFLANYIEANIDEIIIREIEEAAGAGELSCPVCIDEFYNYNNTPRAIDGKPICPKCNVELISVSCSNCGETLTGIKNRPGDIGYTGQMVNNKVVCQVCARLLSSLKKGSDKK